MGFGSFVKRAVNKGINLGSGAVGIGGSLLGGGLGIGGGLLGLGGGSLGLDNITGAKGRRQAASDIESGYNQARSDIASRMPIAQQQLASGMGAARAAAQQGFGEAKGIYNTPEIVASRQELYQRMLGNGGYSPETINAMKAASREEYGTAARDIGMGLNTIAGDAGAQGLAAENYARAMSQLGAQRARNIRDIDIEAAKLAEEQQTAAIPALYQEAAQRAGLSASEAQMLADIEAKLAGGQSGLTAEEAQLLAQIAAGKGAAMASTRDTQGLMPLISSGIQAAGPAIGAAIMASSKTVKNGVREHNTHDKDLKIIEGLKLVKYKYTGSLDDGKEHIGVIAEDAPVEITTLDKRAVHLGDLAFTMASAIKTLSETVRQLQDEIAALKGGKHGTA